MLAPDLANRNVVGAAYYQRCMRLLSDVEETESVFRNAAPKGLLRVNLQDSSMVEQRVAELEQVTCASPDYLKRHGMPTKLDDLSGHRAVNYISTATGKPYPLEFGTGDGMKPVTLPSQVSVSGAEVYTGAAVAGLGLIQVPRYHVAQQLADGALRVVLASHPPPRLPVSVLYPQNRQLSSRVRVFADWLKDQFASTWP